LDKKYISTSTDGRFLITYEKSINAYRDSLVEVYDVNSGSLVFTFPIEIDPYHIDIYSNKNKAVVVEKIVSFTYIYILELNSGR
jgi:hypothetical protein